MPDTDRTASHALPTPTRNPCQPMLFQPARVQVLADLWENADAARRAERICSACAGADMRDLTYADLPDIVTEEGRPGRPPMGQMHTVPPPIPILGLFRFDREAVARDAQRMREACRAERRAPTWG